LINFSSVLVYPKKIAIANDKIRENEKGATARLPLMMNQRTYTLP